MYGLEFGANVRRSEVVLLVSIYDVWVVWVVVESRGNARFGAEKVQVLKCLYVLGLKICALPTYGAEEADISRVKMREASFVKYFKIL